MRDGRVVVQTQLRPEEIRRRAERILKENGARSLRPPVEFEPDGFLRDPLDLLAEGGRMAGECAAAGAGAVRRMGVTVGAFTFADCETAAGFVEHFESAEAAAACCREIEDALGIGILQKVEACLAKVQVMRP